MIGIFLRLERLEGLHTKWMKEYLFNEKQVIIGE